MIEWKIFIKDAKVGSENTLLNVLALYAIFSKLTLDLTEGNMTSRCLNVLALTVL